MSTSTGKPPLRAPALDPQTRSYLEERARLGIPPVRGLTPEQARAGADTQAQALLEAAPQIPVAEVADHVVATGDGAHVPVRVYRDGDASSFVVYFHGGGWVVGTLDTYDQLCRALVSRTGGTLVNVDYRLAPEHPHPIPVEDAWAAVRWTADRAGAAPLVVAGDSAGGHLAAVVAQRAARRGLGLAGQVLIYPVIDPGLALPSAEENGDGFGMGTADMRWYWSHYLGASGDSGGPEVSPLRAELADVAHLPPALMVTAGYDVLRDEDEAYADRLAEAGVAVERARFPDQIHGFVRQFPLIHAGERALDTIAGFIARVGAS